MSGIQVRWARPTDADDVIRLLDVLNAHVEAPVGKMSREDALRDLIEPGRDAETIVAEYDGRVVGCATFFESYESEHVARGAYLLDLAVDPDARRIGVARALVAALSREIQRRGRTFLWWTVWPPNTEAAAFYDSLGAVSEPMIARAVHDQPFEALADAGQELGPRDV